MRHLPGKDNIMTKVVKIIAPEDVSCVWVKQVFRELMSVSGEVVRLIRFSSCCTLCVRMHPVDPTRRIPKLKSPYSKDHIMQSGVPDFLKTKVRLAETRWRRSISTSLCYHHLLCSVHCSATRRHTRTHTDWHRHTHRDRHKRTHRQRSTGAISGGQNFTGRTNKSQWKSLSEWNNSFNFNSPSLSFMPLKHA